MKDKIDYEEIARLVNFLEEKNLTQFELEVGNFRIKISRAAVPTPVFEKAAAPASSSLAANGRAPFPAGTEPEESADNLQYITSPMVGTFYRAPDPSSTPFVDIGDDVKKNQTLCIIEAMKLMNEIESDVEGVIKEIYAENGKPVEYGQKLFAIQPVS
jgi:acetyl-CoA carboxylase biotin carboxyl carrier protein